MDQTYGNLLRKYVSDPGSYAGSPGFKFGLDTGLDSLSRSNSRMRGSGNALADLVKFGTGYAQQDRGAEIDRLTRASGQEQTYDLGQEANRLTGVRDANSYSLGQEGNRLTGIRDANNFTLGTGANETARLRAENDYSLGNRNADNTRTANDQQFGLGLYRAGNDYSLGNRNADNTAQNNWWNYDLGRRGDETTRTRDANNFATTNGQAGINWYDAQTRRGAQRSDAWNNDQQNQRAWYSINPQRRYA